MANFFVTLVVSSWLMLLAKILADSVSEVEVFRMFPKLELHAHLHGSIRRTTLEELVGKSNLELPNCKADLHGCFLIFQIIHRAIDNIEKVSRVVTEVLEDFMTDGVIYAELRTTPRALPDGTSKLSYLSNVIAILEEHNQLHFDRMIARLILSIDRGGDVKEAENTLDVVEELQKTSKLIVGIDFSGNPHRGTFVDFRYILDRARSMGLKVTVHAGEISENDSVEKEDSEVSAILDWHPDRIGHLLFLKEYHFEMLYLSGIPLEIAPSSNFYSLGLKTYDSHPTLGHWLSKGYPISICTDDTGVFDTSLSWEYIHVSTAYGVSMQDLLALSYKSIDFVFDSSEETRAKIVQLFNGKASLFGFR